MSGKNKPFIGIRLDGSCRRNTTNWGGGKGGEEGRIHAKTLKSSIPNILVAYQFCCAVPPSCRSKWSKNSWLCLIFSRFFSSWKRLRTFAGLSPVPSHRLLCLPGVWTWCRPALGRAPPRFVRVVVQSAMSWLQRSFIVLAGFTLCSGLQVLHGAQSAFILAGTFEIPKASPAGHKEIQWLISRGYPYTFLAHAGAWLANGLVSCPDPPEKMDG